MTVKTYYKKPDEIEAIHYTGENLDAVIEFVKDSLMTTPTDTKFIQTDMGVVPLAPDVYVVKHGYFFRVMDADTFNDTYALVQ